MGHSLSAMPKSVESLTNGVNSLEITQGPQTRSQTMESRSQESKDSKDSKKNRIHFSDPSPTASQKLDDASFEMKKLISQEEAIHKLRLEIVQEEAKQHNATSTADAEKRLLATRRDMAKARRRWPRRRRR